MEYVTLGKIVKTLGLKGEVKVYSCSDFRQDRYYKGAKVFIFDEKTNTRQTVKVSTFRMDGQMDIVSFQNYQNIDLVTPFVNCLIQVEKNVDELPEDTFFHSDLEKCNVLDEKRNLLGKVIKVEQYAAYKTLRVKRENGKDLLIPFLKAFIVNVDINKHEIIIHVWDGLL